MAGFMAGFGNAFADSYQKAATRRADKEQDIFRYTFAAALDRRKEREAHDKEEAKYVSDAKALVGMEGLPADAVGDAYTMLRAGYTPEQAIKKLKAGSYSQSDPSATPAPEAKAAGDISADPTQAAVDPNNQVSSVDEQTVAAMPGSSGLPDSVGGSPTSEAPAPDASAPAAPAAVDVQAPVAETPSPNAPTATAQAPGAPQPAAPDTQAPVQVAQADVAPVSEADAMVPDKIRQQVEQAMGGKMDLSPVSDTPAMAPSGHFIPGPDPLDFPPDKEIQYRFDTAKTPADKALYGGMLKAVQERVDAEALAKNPQDQSIIMFKNDQGIWTTKGVYKDDQGNELLADGSGPKPKGARYINDAEQKVRDEISRGTDAGTKILSKQAKIASLYPDANALIQEAYAQPEVLNSVGSIASWISSADANIQSVKQIIENSAPESATVDNQLAKIDGMLAKTPIADIAQRTSLFRSKILLMGYRAGDIEGQKGQSLNEKDFSRLQQVLSGADNNPATFAKLIKSYMSDLTANADVEIKSYNDSNGLAVEYEKHYGAGSAPGNAFIKPMQDMVMGSDDATKQAYHDLQKAGETKVNLPDERHAPVDTSAIPPEAINDLKANPNSAAAFDAWFGEGASDAVLGKKKDNGGSNPK